jgi:hypothetical protein
MFECYDIEDEACVMERHDDDAINTQNSVISHCPHEHYKVVRHLNYEALVMKIPVFWNMMSCNLAHCRQRFGGP